MRSVAKELGISEEAIDNALSTIISVSQKDSGSLKSIKRVLVRTIDCEISEDDLAIVTEEFPPVHGSGGARFQFGRTVQFRAQVGAHPCNVTIARRSGKTEIRVKSDASLGILPVALAAIISFFIIGSAALGLDFGSGFVQDFMQILLLPALSISLGIWWSRAALNAINERILSALDDTTSKIVEMHDQRSEEVAVQSQAVEGPVEGDVQTRIQE